MDERRLTIQPDLPVLDLISCPDCGLLHRLPRGPAKGRGECVRCGAPLARLGPADFDKPLALALAALVAAGVALSYPLMSISFAGNRLTGTLESGIRGLWDQGFAAIALLIAALTIAAPLLRLTGIIYVLAVLRTPQRPDHLAQIFLLTEWMRRWMMPDVYLLGACVAYSRLQGYAYVDAEAGGYALVALVLASAATDSALPRHAVWRAIGEWRVGAGKGEVGKGEMAAAAVPRSWVACPECGLVIVRPDGGRGRDRCPRCGSRLDPRKPDSLMRTAALTATGYILYLPANLYPILTVVRFGWRQTSTILGGVEELVQAQLWPLALLVLVASILVPVFKLLGLTGLLLSVRLRSRRGLRARALLYRIVEGIGRWSMVDVFMISILVGLLQFGALTSVNAEIGAVAFAAVVIVTMIAAMTFDPRLMWDVAEQARAEQDAGEEDHDVPTRS